MEPKTRHFIVFDACSLINLLFIDYNYQEIFRFLKEYVDFRLPERVQHEIRDNIKIKLSSIEVKNNRDKEYKEDLTKFIEMNVGDLWKYVSQDQQLKKDIKFDQLEKYLANDKQNKINGEWHCAVHSLYLSRLHQVRLSFCTDDNPAKVQYENLFFSQKVGIIEDTSDILLLLYWNCPDIDRKKLKNYLRDLYAQYKGDVNKLLKIVRNFRYYNLKASNKEISRSLFSLEDSLMNLDLENLLIQKGEVLRNSGSHKKELKNIFSKYESIFEIAGKNNLLNKIDMVINHIDNDGIYKVY